MHEVLEQHRRLATANLRYVDGQAPSMGIINEGTIEDDWTVSLPFSLVKHTDSDVLPLRVDIDALRDEGGRINLLSYPLISSVRANYRMKGSNKIRSGLSVIEFRLEDHGRCRHCLGRVAHARKENCPALGHCILCGDAMDSHIHRRRHLTKECMRKVIKTLIRKRSLLSPRV